MKTVLSNNTCNCLVLERFSSANEAGHDRSVLRSLLLAERDEAPHLGQRKEMGHQEASGHCQLSNTASTVCDTTNTKREQRINQHHEETGNIYSKRCLFVQIFSIFSYIRDLQLLIDTLIPVPTGFNNQSCSDRI